MRDIAVTVFDGSEVSEGNAGVRRRNGKCFQEPRTLVCANIDRF